MNQEQTFQTPKRFDWCVNQSYNYSPNYSYSSPESGYNSSFDTSQLATNSSYIDNSTSSPLADNYMNYYQNYQNYYNYSQYYNYNYYNQYEYNQGYYYNYQMPQSYTYQSYSNQSVQQEEKTSNQNESIEYQQETPEKKKTPTKPQVNTAELDANILSATEHTKGRSRTAFSHEQRLYLLSIFKITSYPTRDLLEEAAKELNTTKTIIQTWFKNTRSKQKKLIKN